MCKFKVKVTSETEYVTSCKLSGEEEQDVVAKLTTDIVSFSV